MQRIPAQMSLIDELEQQLEGEAGKEATAPNE